MANLWKKPDWFLSRTRVKRKNIVVVPNSLASYVAGR
jgi:hypothetical protein